MLMKRLAFLVTFTFLGSLALNNRAGLNTSYFLGKGIPTPLPVNQATTNEIFMNEACRLPCLFGLNVGTDELSDVLSWLEAFPQVLDYRTIDIDDKYEILAIDFVISDPVIETREHVILDFWIDKQSNTLVAVQLSLGTIWPQYWEAYMPRAFFDNYGEPEQHRLQAIISSSMPPTFSFVTHYVDMGLYVEYHGFLENNEAADSSTKEVCITEETTFILLWFQPPDASDSSLWNEFVFGEEVGQDWEAIELEINAEALENLYEDHCFSVESTK
jgi:hypothetical protein